MLTFLNSIFKGEYPLLNAIRSSLMQRISARVISANLKTYTVVSGDICYSIAQQAGITVDQLIKWNPSVNAQCTNLYVGQILNTKAPAWLDNPSVTTKAPTVEETTDLFASLLAASQRRFVCYYPSWSSLRPNMIDSHLCTHIIYAFATIQSNKLTPVAATDIESYKSLVSLRADNPNLRILISCGGKTHLYKHVRLCQETNANLVYLNS
jgi:LysM repeat protein